MSFDLQVQMFTDQLAELIEQAKAEAGLEFATERSNWEQEIRVLDGEIQAWQSKYEAERFKAEAAEQQFLTLQSKLSALV